MQMKHTICLILWNLLIGLFPGLEEMLLRPFYILQVTGKRGLEFQKKIIDNVLKQSCVQHVMPYYVTNHKNLLQYEVVCSNLALAWEDIKYARGKDHHIAKNVIEAAVVSTSSDNNVRAAAKCAGLNRKAIAKAIRRRQLLDMKHEGERWAKGDRKTRRDALSDEVKDLVTKWYVEETRVSPIRDQVVRRLVDRKLWEYHLCHLLQDSELDFYSRFKAQYPEVQIGFVSFHKLKPFFVRKLKDFNSCCCRYHQEMIEIMVAFNNMRACHCEGFNKNCRCSCEAICSNPVNGSAQGSMVSCQAPFHTYNSSSDLWQMMLCPKRPGAKWYDINCLRGICSQCGIRRLPVCDYELDPANKSVVSWRLFEKVFASKTRDGDDKEVVRLESKVTRPREFLEYVVSKLQKFIYHHFSAQWQDAQFKLCKDKLEDDEVISLIDFSENYSFKNQDEIQSQHWYNFQVSILVHIMYTVNPDYNHLDSKSRRLKTKYFYYISDDRNHDNLFVQHAFSLHWKYMIADGFYPTRHFVWSEGCSSQSKGARSWFYVARYPSLTVCP